MGRATSNGNEAKSKMKHPSDMPKPRFKLRCSIGEQKKKQNKHTCGFVQTVEYRYTEISETDETIYSIGKTLIKYFRTQYYIRKGTIKVKRY